MTKVVVDDNLVSQLAQLKESAQLCDASGRMLGQFLPIEIFHALFPPADHCPYSVEELLQYQQESGGRSLKEIWQSLGRS